MQLASRTQSNAPKARADIVGGIVRLLIQAPTWEWVTYVDRDPPTGVLRDRADNVSHMTGVDEKTLLVEVVNAMTYQKPRFLVVS